MESVDAGLGNPEVLTLNSIPIQVASDRERDIGKIAAFVDVVTDGIDVSVFAGGELRIAVIFLYLHQCCGLLWTLLGRSPYGPLSRKLSCHAQPGGRTNRWRRPPMWWGAGEADRALCRALETEYRTASTGHLSL